MISSFAKALFDQAKDKQSIDRQLAEWSHYLKNHPKESRFLLHPDIPLEVKKKVIEKVVPDPLFVNFLLLLMRKNKLLSLPYIAAEYHELWLKDQGALEATLVTATAASQELQEKLREKLKRTYEKEIVLEAKTDPQIVGGAMIYLNHHLLDYSTKGRLARLKKRLLGENHAET